MESQTTSTSWHSYPSIFAIGHRAAAQLFSDPVIVQEKIDGSQISFGIFDGELRIKSKGAIINLDEPEKMFTRAVEVIKSLSDGLVNGWTYRGEYLQKPKHNVLAYDRIPNQHIILFDINVGHEEYADYENVSLFAERLGFEVVPRLYHGQIGSADALRGLLDTISILGGSKVEGVVVKNYAKFGPDGKALMGKYVSERFKEVAGGEWRANNPTIGDIIDRLIVQYKTPARWDKAIQHLMERGELEGSPRDIGKLIREIPADVLKECRDEIVEKLFTYAWQHIQRGIVAGMPEYYKQRLLESQFSES